MCGGGGVGRVWRVFVCCVRGVLVYGDACFGRDVLVLQMMGACMCVCVCGVCVVCVWCVCVHVCVGYVGGEVGDVCVCVGGVSKLEALRQNVATKRCAK